MKINTAEVDLITKQVLKSLYLVPILADKMSQSLGTIVEMDNLSEEDPKLIMRLFIDSVKIVVQDTFGVPFEVAMNEYAQGNGQIKIIDQEDLTATIEEFVSMNEERKAQNDKIISMFPEDMRNDPQIENYPWFRFGNPEKLIDYIIKSEAESKNQTENV